MGANLQGHESVAVPVELLWDVPGSAFQDDAALFHRSRLSWIGVDLEISFFAGPLEAGGISMRVGVVPPMASGAIRLRSSDAEDVPLIDPRFLSVPSDVSRLILGIRESLPIAATPPLDQWIKGVAMTSGLTSEMGIGELTSWVHTHAEGFAHTVGGDRRQTRRHGCRRRAAPRPCAKR